MTIAERLRQLKLDIAEEELKSHRIPGSVSLLAVSKGQPVEKIREAYACGLRSFAESYLQEAEKKMQDLSDLPISWHFIGPIQSNKARVIAREFDWVHSVSRPKIAALLHQHRPKDAAPLNICLQINLSGEKSKAGMRIEEAYEMAVGMKHFKRLNCRGLMTIPPENASTTQQFELFSALTALLHDINHHSGLNMDTLSMGMSNDLSPAIRAGSTIVRIGRALFGERQ